MKQLIFGLAIIILWTGFSIFQIDNNRFLRYQEDLKYQANECSNTAALYYDTDQFGEGKKVFDRTRANNAIEEIIKLNMKLDNNLEPNTNSYWTEAIEYYVYYFDDSGITRTYKNKVLEKQAAFSYGSLFTEPLTGYKKLITEPTAIVTINAGKAYYRLSFIDTGDVIRTSAYEYLENH